MIDEPHGWEPQARLLEQINSPVGDVGELVGHVDELHLVESGTSRLHVALVSEPEGEQ